VKQNWKGVGTYGTVGLEFAISVLFGLLGGDWLDKKLGTHFIAVIGFCLGLAAGVRAIWLAARQATRDLERMDREEHEARKKFNDQDHHD
jgi:ATP synthase protein I